MTKYFNPVVHVFILLALLAGVLPAGLARASEGQPGPDQPAFPTAGVQVFLPAVFRQAEGIGSSESPLTLIGKDLQAGAIDYPTSLRYRAYAWFEDPRLPKKYWGSGPAEDLGLFEEIRSPLEPLPADVQAELATFTARPDDPSSVFNPEHNPAQSDSARSAPSAPGELYCDANNWTALAPTDFSKKFKVHSKCDGEFYEDDIRFVMGVLEAHYDDMVAIMGQPILDQGGAKGGYTDDIDIYLLDPLDKAPRQYSDNLDTSNRHGLASADAPFQDMKSSGYVLLKRYMVYDPFMADVIIHEFFHVLQFAHNREIFFKEGVEWWFGEASATWAQSHFLPETAEKHVHFPQFFVNYRGNKVPLGLAANLHSPQQPLLYAQYMWPLFMEQELGAQSIGHAWRNLEGIDDWYLGMDAISKELPFETNFRRFAQRTLNLKLEPSGGPITPRFKDLNSPPAVFPDNLAPVPEDEREEIHALTRQDDPQVYSTTIPSLRPIYYHFGFNPDANKVILDLSPLSGYGNIQVDLVIKPWNEPWEIRQLGLTSIELCDTDEMWLIISNTEMDYTKTTPVEFSLLPLSESCDCAAVAQALVKVDYFKLQFGTHYEASASIGNESVHTTNDINIASDRLYPIFMGPTSAGFRADTFTGQASIDYAYSKGTYGNSISGAGLPVPYDIPRNDYSRFHVHFDLTKCTYNINNSTFIEATFRSGNDSSTGIVDVGSTGSGPYPADESLVLGGSGSFPAHTPEYILVQPDIFDFFSQDDWEIFDMLGEDGMGFATVTWSITPVFKP